MKVAFDQQVFLLQEYGGISLYICSLVKELELTPDMQTEVVIPLHFNHNLAVMEHLAGALRLIPRVSTKLFRLVAFASKHLARRSISRFRSDILHDAYYSVDDYKASGAKRLLTVYDLIHQLCPELFERSHMTTESKKAAVQRTDNIIWISERTRRD